MPLSAGPTQFAELNEVRSRAGPEADASARWDALTRWRCLCPDDGFGPGRVALACPGPDHVKSCLLHCDDRLAKGATDGARNGDRPVAVRHALIGRVGGRECEGACALTAIRGRAIRAATSVRRTQAICEKAASLGTSQSQRTKAIADWDASKLPSVEHRLVSTDGHRRLAVRLLGVEELLTVS
jgi:hypothetical protein